MTQTSFKNSNPSTKYIFGPWFLFLSVLAGFAAYYRMFTGFNFYDDEGALLVTVKEYLGGLRLYNRIYVPYGPIYYFYNWAVRTISHTPATHDAVRMSSLIPWLLTALVSAWIVFRFTGSLALASITHLLVSLRLADFFRNEPGHPQELCILLLVCLVAAGIVYSIPRWRLFGIVLLGVLTAALLLIKVNIGIFAFLAVSLAVLAHSRRSKISRLAMGAVSAASIMLPLILMKSHLQDGPARMFVILVVTSIVAVLWTLYRAPRTSCLSFRDSWVAFGSFAVAFAGVILGLKVQGIDFNAMLHALLLDSLTTYVLRGAWYIPLPADPGWLPLTLGGFAAALLFSWRGAQKPQGDEEVHYLKLTFCVFATIGIYFLMPPFRLVLPFCWLVLYGKQDATSKSSAFPRTLLCTATVLQTLYAYPIAGSQLHFIQVLPIIVVMTCLGDVFTWQKNKLSVMLPTLYRVVPLVVLLLVAASYLVIARAERETYNSLPSLQLRGAERIHLYETQGRDYRWLAQNLNDHCDISIGVPEVPSLHIWTGKNPLAGMEMDDWVLVASDEKQIAASAILSQHPDACAIYNPDLVAFWNRSHLNLERLPLVHYLHENFKVVGATGQFYFLVRNERDLPIGSPEFQAPFDPTKVNALWKSKGCLGKGCSF